MPEREKCFYPWSSNIDSELNGVSDYNLDIMKQGGNFWRVCFFIDKSENKKIWKHKESTMEGIDSFDCSSFKLQFGEIIEGISVI